MRRRLRRELRDRRRAIRGTARRLAAQQLAYRADAAGWLRPGARIGLYLATPEEIDTSVLLRLARRRGCSVALPRVLSLRHDSMCFIEFTGTVRRGAFGIREPAAGRRFSARELDVVFMPLVGFDAAGHRIGMGRGFYDRHFAYRLRHARIRRPLLVGLAFNVQQVPSLPLAGHDVPLDAIVTESSTLRIHRSRPACVTGC